MKLETFFEKFEIFAEVPDAVGKMRELVLEMALQGNLSQQCVEDARDPHWLELVQRIDADAESAKAEADAPYEIPSVWRWTTLETLGETKPRNDAPDSTQASFVPMALIPAEYGLSPKHEVRSWSAIKKGYTHFQDDDVVMAKITPCFENGKSAVMSGLTGGVGAGTTELHVFRRSGSAVLPEFVVIQLKSRGFVTRGIPRMTGSAGQKRVPYDYFARTPFPLPPLAEQKRIVEKVDELMELCDRLEAQQQERETRHAALARASLARFAAAPTPANLDLLFHKSYNIPPADLRKSILTLAVQGKLVPQGPNDEPAEVSSESDEKLVAQSSFEIPHGWIWNRLSQLADINGGFAFKSTDYTCEGTRVVRISDFDEFGFKDHKVVRHRFTPDLQKFSLAQSNILMAMTGGTVGKSYLVKSLPEAMVVNQRVATIKILEGASPNYIDIVIRSEMIQEVILKAKNSTNDNISMGDIKGFAIPVPPLAEQRRIVAKVDELMALVDALETQLATARSSGSTLINAAVSELTASA